MYLQLNISQLRHFGMDGKNTNQQLAVILSVSNTYSEAKREIIIFVTLLWKVKLK